MMMIRGARKFLMLTSIALLGSCDKGDDPAVVPCLLTSQTGSNGITYTFNYQDGALASMVQSNSSATSVTTFEYDAGKLIKLHNAGDINSVFTYTGDNITMQERFSGTKVTDRTEYEYDGDHLTRIQEYDNFGSGLQKTSYRTFEYSDNSDNILREKRFAATSSTTPDVILDLTYGTNNSALGAFPDAATKYFKLGGLPIWSNVVKVVFNDGQEINYTYEFNDKGYPTKRTETYSNGIVNVQTNTYDCN